MKVARIDTDQAPEQEIVFPIEGMTCAACQLRVEGALRALEGVHEASVNLLAHRANVRFDPRRTTPQSCVAAVDRVGFDASLPLRPVTLVEQTRAAHERRRSDFLKLSIRAGLASVVAIFAMAASGHGAMAGSEHGAMAASYSMGFSWVDAFVVGASLALGFSIFERGVRELYLRAPGMDALVTLGSAAALALTAGAWLQFASFHGQHHADGIPTLVAALLVGRTLEARAKGETLVAQASLAALLPARTVLLRDGHAVPVPTRELLPGDVVRVSAGEAFPCDGSILLGESDADESALTGEARPVTKGPGDGVIAGTRNGLGTLDVRVASVGDGTMLAAILYSAEISQRHRGELEGLAARAIRPFVPAMMIVALLVAGAWGFHAGAASALLHGANVLLVACPCALGLAVPAAITVALGRASSLGILLRRGSAMEQASAVTHACFDKTGTLTTGHMSISSAHAAIPHTEAALRHAAAVAEEGIDHPLARALQVPRAASHGWSRRVVPGRGVIATRLLDAIVVGTPAFVAAELHQRLPDEPKEFGTPIAVAQNGIFVGYLLISDTLRPGAAELVAALRRRHISVTVLTGDDAVYTEMILAPLAVEAHCRMTPDGKREAIEALRAKNPKCVVLFVGDGINDAPALAAADVSVALSSGTAIARSVGDALLLHDDVRNLVPFLSLARHTVQTMKRNLGWAALYNLLALPLAAGVFEGFGVHMTPTVAGAAMAASSLGVLVQSLALRWTTLEKV